MAEIGRFLKSHVSTLEADEALSQQVASLLGVASAAQAALAVIGVHTIFDLATARVFATAKDLLAIQRDPGAAEARLNMVSADAVAAPVGVPVSELADRSIAILRGIGAENEAALSSVLDVETVRDLALWPPYGAAREILQYAFAPEKVPGFDAEAPADLLPKSGIYPTERILFRKLVLDAVAEPDGEALPIETAEPIDLGARLAAPTGFQRVANGALLTFSQSWFAQGLALGQLLHSTALAPGESTRIAMIDWSRRTRASASETISEAEQLTNTMTHSRAVSEVTDATAHEFQTGKSKTRTTSTTDQEGAALGFEIGPVAFGGSASRASSTTESMSASSSFGERDLAASYAQGINDRTQQNASVVRNRRASVVREVSQEEHERISTRVVTNYNHMHALSIQYYEVVQAFRVTSQLERAEKCLFVPLKPIDFRQEGVIARWRQVLADDALTLRTRRQLTVEYGVVEVIPQTPRVTPGRIIVGGFRRTSLSRRADGAASSTRLEARESGEGAVASLPEPPRSDGADLSPDYSRAPVNTPAAVLSAKGWNIEQLNAIGWATGSVLMRPGSDSVFLSDDALVIGFNLRDGQATRFSARRRDGSEIFAEHSSPTAFALASPLLITELQSISIQTAGDQDLRAVLVLQLNVLGTVFPLDIPVAVRPMSSPQEVVRFGAATAARELVDHLESNRLHYSQAIYRTLEPATIAALLAPYNYRGFPLSQVVDPQPVAVTANFLVFRVSVSASGRSEDERWVAEENEWRSWLERRGLARSSPRSEIVPLPSGGVFAEAVLGRFNSAERLDVSRFWNWQNSPIPITAPDIAPIQAGSRAQQEDLRPGQLSTPVLGIQVPTALPEPTGLAAALAAVQNGNMFRDMSGLAQSAALAQSALQATAQGATSAGAQASQNLSTVMSNNTERMRIAAQLAAAMLGAPDAGGGNGGGGRSPENVSEEGARLNYARGIDERNGDGAGSDASSRGGSNGEVSETRPQFAAAREFAKTSMERDTFDLLTGNTATKAAKDALGLATNNASPGAGGGAASGAKPKSRKVKGKFFFIQGGSASGNPFGGEVQVTIWEGGDSYSDHPLGRRLLKPAWKTLGSARSFDVTIPAVATSELTVQVRVRIGQVDWDLSHGAGQRPNIFHEVFVVPVLSNDTIDVKIDVDIATATGRLTASDANDAIAKGWRLIAGQGFYALGEGSAQQVGTNRFEVDIPYYSRKMIFRGTGRVWEKQPLMHSTPILVD